MDAFDGLMEGAHIIYLIAIFFNSFMCFELKCVNEI